MDTVDIMVIWAVVLVIFIGSLSLGLLLISATRRLDDDGISPESIARFVEDIPRFPI